MAYPNTLGDIKNEVLVEGNINTTIAHFTDDQLNDWVDKAHKWAAGLHPWSFVRGKASTTYASLVTNEEGDLEGEYFEGWKPSSIRYLMIGGYRVKNIMFSRFRQLREEQSSNDSRVFTNVGNLYLVNPSIDVSGTITAWGYYTPANLDGTDPNSETVFSETETGNGAIVDEVLSYVKKRQQKLNEAQAHHQEALAKLAELWENFKDEQFSANDHEISDGMFERIDYATGIGIAELNNRDRFY